MKTLLTLLSLFLLSLGVGLSIYAYHNMDSLTLPRSLSLLPGEAAASPDDWQTYTNDGYGFTLTHPPGYVVDEAQQNGVLFSPPAGAISDTNLSSDTGLIVGRYPGTTGECSPKLFASGVKTVTRTTENGVTYLVATTTGSGAGSTYEQVIYALPNSNPCVSVAYLIHATAIGNYTAGSVRAYNRAALLDDFDKMRRSLVLR